MALDEARRAGHHAVRASAQRWNFTPDVREQLEALAASQTVASIIVTPTDVRWLESDLNHAILKRGCRDKVVIELADRVEYVERTGDGTLDGWR